MTPHDPAADYPRFSEEEFERRRTAIREMMAENGVDALVVYGHSGLNRRYQANVYYLANYMDHHHNYLVFFADPAEETTLFIGLGSHVPTAVAWAEVDDVRSGGSDPARSVVDRIDGTAAAGGRIGLVGPRASHGITLPHPHYETLSAGLSADLVDVSTAYERIRTIKGGEELEWLREGARLTDLAMEALEAALEPGVTELELKAEWEYAYLKEGGDPHISFISSTPMDDPEPGKCLHWKQASNRSIREGDVVNTEIGAGYWGYNGQMQRTFSVARPPSARYRDLHDVAEETFDSVLAALKPGNTDEDLLRAAAPLIESEYTIYDALVHGFGVDILPPSIGHGQIEAAKDGDYAIDDPVEIEENIVVVVQPNPITRDERYGVQVGDAVVVTEDGPESLHEYPFELVHV